GAACAGRGPDGDPAGTARPPLPQRVVVDRRRPGRGHRAVAGLAAGDTPTGRPVRRRPGRGGARRPPRRPGHPGPPRVGAVRAPLIDDLDTRTALTAVDAWAAHDGDDADAPALVRSAVDA